jgi:asparagine synthase (glutamine-hydrolysing)
MCGIAGLISRSGRAAEWTPNVLSMSCALRHRGPDSDGFYEADPLLLAVRRLAIIDLVGGSQPIFNEDRQIVVIANCEIYNFVELSESLEQSGHRFSTTSDAEVIVHLYEEYGPDCVHHLRGMFAFALWDARTSRLVLARDRMGEKPLYLFESEGYLLFASELKSILASGLVPFDLDVDAVNSYLHYSFVPEPRTPVKGVRKLPAGHILSVEVQPWHVREKHYWRMEDAPPLEGNPGALIRSELESIARIVTRADVPVGIALSGGLDSSAVAVLLARKSEHSLQCFSVGYPNHPSNDESTYAESLARELHLDFTRVELTTSDIVSSFAELTRRMDDPIADIAGPGYAALARIAAEAGVKVLIFGQGGDELFWGYPWVVDAVAQSERKGRVLRGGSETSEYFRLRKPASWSRAAISKWVRSMAGLRSGWVAWHRDRTAQADQLVFYDLAPTFRYARRHSPALFRDSVPRSFNSRPESLFTLPVADEMMDIAMTRLICDTYLMENGIAQADRLSMSFSVEPRMPLVDYRLVETVIGLRKVNKDHRLPPKAWLKTAVADLLPPSVLGRQKRGFQPPVREWLNAIFAQHGELLHEGYLAQCGLFDSDAVRRLASPARREKSLAYAMLVLESWARQMTSIARQASS